MQIKKEHLFLQTVATESKISRLTEISFSANHVKNIANCSDEIFWNEDFFSLSNSKLWKSLTREKQQTVLRNMNTYLLREAYYIENAGMLYAAKMNMISESIEERAFFSIMGFEEARHLQTLKPFFSKDIHTQETPAFSQHIGNIILDGDKTTNLFLIQILLEGWGLTYYQSLVDYTQHSGLRDAFKGILRDETRHHSAGVILLDKQHSDKNSFLTESYSNLLEMVRVGPWTLVNEIKNQMQDLTKSDIKSFLIEIDAEKNTALKLKTLKSLTEKSLSSEIVKLFEKNKLWTSYSLDDMALAHS